MKKVGIFVEYNPFHTGHLYHLEQSKKYGDIIVAIMSPHVVQRGEIALFNKFKRARNAIDNGVDIVCELPSIFTLQSAQNFSQGMVECANLAKVDYVVFGAENPNTDLLFEIANSNVGEAWIKSRLDAGNSYNKILRDNYQLFANDILAISYIRALKKYPHIKPIIIQRENNYHDLDSIGNFVSASAIRQHRTEEIYQKYSLINLENSYYPEIIFPYLKYKILCSSKQELANIFLVEEGIESLFKKEILINNDYNSFIQNCTSKRYSTSRIRRTLLMILFDITKKEVNNLSPLKKINLLAFNHKARAYLKENNQHIASKINQYQKDYFEIELKINQLLSYICQNDDFNNLQGRYNLY